MENPHDVTQLLLKWSQGEQGAIDELLPLVYRELHKIAHRYLNKERGEHTLQTTALVHEAYIKLIDQNRVQWQNRAHFYGIAAQMMRRILVDYARSRNYAKRGGGTIEIPLDEALTVSNTRNAELIALDEALDQLSEFDKRKAQIVELRCFGGLTVEEAAEVLDVSPGTIVRDWTLAKAWLRREISHSAAAE